MYKWHTSCFSQDTNWCPAHACFWSHKWGKGGESRSPAGTQASWLWVLGCVTSLAGCWQSPYPSPRCPLILLNLALSGMSNTLRLCAAHLILLHWDAGTGAVIHASSFPCMVQKLRVRTAVPWKVAIMLPMCLRSGSSLCTLLTPTPPKSMNTFWISSPSVGSPPWGSFPWPSLVYLPTPRSGLADCFCFLHIWLFHDESLKTYSSGARTICTTDTSKYILLPWI